MWKKNNLKKEIFRYFLLFSLIIIGVLWLVQFLFFKSFYKEQKINDIKQVAEKIKKTKPYNLTEQYLNELALEKSICIEIDDTNFNQQYVSSYFGKDCITDVESTMRYKIDFLKSNKTEETYELIHPKYENHILIHALKTKDNRYIFTNTSLEDINGTITLIRKQLIVISFLLLILSYILALFISSMISKPIKQMSKEAMKLAKGDFNIQIREDSSIEEIEELASSLNYAKKELSKTEELRRDLMANVSHDLKTPLTMIKGTAEMAKDLHSNNKEKQEEDMNTIISESNRLTNLVNDILELSKMETVEEELKLEEFDLIETIYDVLKRYEVLTETEKYDFEFIHSHKNIKVFADKKKIEQVLYNLINNAINYTGDDNKVTIRVIKKDNVTVEIKDTGKGIKKEEIPYIWDKYYKNKKKHKRNLVGTGLGLSIVKKILEQHSFPYGVISKEGKGTTFYFQMTKKEEL